MLKKWIKNCVADNQSLHTYLCFISISYNSKVADFMISQMKNWATRVSSHFVGTVMTLLKADLMINQLKNWAKFPNSHLVGITIARLVIVAIHFIPDAMLPSERVHFNIFNMVMMKNDKSAIVIKRIFSIICLSEMYICLQLRDM